MTTGSVRADSVGAARVSLRFGTGGVRVSGGGNDIFGVALAMLYDTYNFYF